MMLKMRCHCIPGVRTSLSFCVNKGSSQLSICNSVPVPCFTERDREGTAGWLSYCRPSGVTCCGGTEATVRTGRDDKSRT